MDGEAGMRKLLTFMVKHEAVSEIQRMAAFAVSFYLTMDMFVEMVRGDRVKEWIFIGICLVYESSKVSILKKSFVLDQHRVMTRTLALVLMTLSVVMASMSAVRAVGTERQALDINYTMYAAQLEDLQAQKEDFERKLSALPPDYRTTSIMYLDIINQKQQQIDETRRLIADTSIQASTRGGIFDEVAELLNLDKSGARLIKFLLFIAMIVLIECILYVETYIVSLAQRINSGAGPYPTIWQKIGRWKIFHHEQEVEDIVRETTRTVMRRIDGASEDLF
jgi:hypothetical protein